MKEAVENSGSPRSAAGGVGFMSRLIAQKKKTTMAACLVLVMVFMWVKVLTPSAPDSATAAVVGDAVGQSESQLRITYVELPVVKGRNDTLVRDFFAVGKGFLRAGVRRGGVNVVVDGASEELTRRIVEKLELEAIVFGENPQAFINDELLSEGDKLLVKEGATEYEFVVVKIGQSIVFIRCGEAEITLRLAPPIEGTD
jgi:hypothetical protein